MKVLESDLPGVLILEPVVYGDHRGFFLETYREQRYREVGIRETFVQDNHSRSRQGVLRGLHYQLRHPQGKLVSVMRGHIYDVVVDIRRGSPSFGQWLGVELSDENHRQLYVPPGFAHGFCVLSEVTDFIYKCTDIYRPEDEYGVRWDDPELAISWPTDDTPRLSEKDLALPLLSEVAIDLLPVYRAGL